MRRVLRHRVVESVSNRSLERLVKNPAPAHGVQLVEVALELRDMGWRPLLHNRGVKAAQLRHMKERPGTLDGCWRLRYRELFSKALAQLRRRSVEGNLTRRVLECRAFEQQAHRKISAQCYGQVPCRNAVGTLFYLPHDTSPTAECEQFGGEIVVVLVLMHTEFAQGGWDQLKPVAFPPAAVPDHIGT